MLGNGAAAGGRRLPAPSAGCDVTATAVTSAQRPPAGPGVGEAAPLKTPPHPTPAPRRREGMVGASRAYC